MVTAVTRSNNSTGSGNNTTGNTQSQPQSQTQTHTVSAKVRKTIQSIKEIVGNFSDADIYIALKECNMDPNETTQKLLNQDPFHEVKSRRDKRKESMGYRGLVDSRKPPENSDQGMKSRPFSDRDVRRGSYSRPTIPNNAVTNREFRVVRDNRTNGNTNGELKPDVSQISTSTSEQGLGIVREKRSSTGSSINLNPYGFRNSSHTSNGPIDSQFRQTRDASLSVSEKRELVDEKRNKVGNVASRVQAVKSNSSQRAATLASNSSLVGVYSSSTDPVHVPSPDSKSPAAIGAIKREVGVVGGRRPAKDSSTLSTSLSSSVLGKDGALVESFRPFSASAKTDQTRQTSGPEPALPSISASRSLLSNQYNSRPHQAVVNHQKAALQNKEWKPKSSKKPSVVSPGVIGTPTNFNSSHDSPKELEMEAADMREKLSQVKINESQNVIIAQHIRVPENDRFGLTFGSFGTEFSSGPQAGGLAEGLNTEAAVSLSASVPESSNDNTSGSKQTELLDDQGRNTGSNSPASEHQLLDKSSSPPNLDNYAEIGMVQDTSPSYVPSESYQQQDPRDLSNFSTYDPQTGYDMSYFRPAIDETVRGQGLPSPQEALVSHAANSTPSTIPMVQQQQQQPPMAQMYPQVHVSHYPNMMPYRQFLSPVYVPQMAVPGYSNNPAYPHPSNGNSFVLMPGGSSHLSANGLKYGIQQFKPVAGSSPTGYGNFASPTGYAINSPGVVGSGMGLEESSQIKYKDGNLYVPNQQVDTSEMWIQNPRELAGMQSGPYYNMQGQTPHAAYMPSHTGHASFNAAAAQSSHMQFPGLYPPPPPQPAAMGNAHHLGPVMGSNVGVGVGPATPGAQGGSYQQPQLGHMNWTTNF